MVRDFVANRWFLGGIGFLIVLSVACYFWYQHDIADERKAAADAEKLLRQSEITKKFDTDSVAGQAADVAAAESNTPTAEIPITDTTQDNETTNIETNTDNGVIARATEPVRMSKHGFGPLPPIPLGAPIADFYENDSVQQELLGRVLVKLWNDGDRNIRGGWISGDTLKVYPHYDDVIYVKYGTEFNVLTGQYETKIIEATSSYENTGVVDAVVRGNVPSGYKLIDVNESGINSYEYLDLPNR